MLIKGSCNIKFMYKKCLSFIHWLGFSISCVMLVLAYFDQSQDEIVIHLIASSMPHTLGWIIVSIIGGKRNYFPFLVK